VESTKNEARRARLGFRDGDRGTHSSRALMFDELCRVLAAVPASAGRAEYRRAVVADNVLGKRTEMNREHSARKLGALFGLDSALPVFRGLRRFWEVEETSQPLLALLCALARDPLLRMTVPAVLEREPGAEIRPEAIGARLLEMSGGRFSASSVRSIGRNVLATWTRSGHLAGHTTKRRARVAASPAATAYALFLGYLEGVRAQRLFATQWTRVLDATTETLLDLARAASARGLIDFRNVGDVIEVRFPDLLTKDEQEMLHE